jgi:tetratricopeptide (TPR) repeat protein
MAIPEVTAEPTPEPAPPVAEAKHEPVKANATPASPGVKEEVHEVDLSDEWATLLDESRAGKATAEAPAATPKPLAEPASIEEFQIGEESAIVPADEAPAIAAFDVATGAPSTPTKPHPFAEISAEIPVANQAKEVPASQTPKKPAKPSEAEFELEQDYELVLDPEPLVPAYDQKPPEAPVAHNAATAPPAGSGFASDQFLADLAKEIDGLGMDKLSPSFSGATPTAQVQSTAKHVAAPASPTETGPLKEVFEEFRAELGEMGAEEEDLETHYNLGIAFREMGLLEEAISEFQKVAKATERGRPFPYIMQCCTLLGLAFMEKGQPGIAAIWYERALQTPGNDPESTLALRYDLGVAQETAGEQDAALKSFSQVYAMNIDYRDVAERIAALQKPIR